MGIRDYICKLQTALKLHLKEEHGIASVPSDNTGVFLDEKTKIASIGVQVRHRLTSHGFAINVTAEPAQWFEQVVACGLVDVRAGCIADASTTRSREGVAVAGEINGMVKRFGRVFGREVLPLTAEEHTEMCEAIRSVEDEARRAGPWPTAPSL